MSDKNFASFGDLEAILPSYAQDIKSRLKKVIAMPSNPSDKETVLFTGTTTSQYKKGGIYEYAQGVEIPLFAWTESDTTIFTEIETPSAGDSVYDSEGAEIGTIESIGTGKITVGTTEYDRDSESDTTLIQGRGWNLISTSDLTAGDGIIIDGEVISSDTPIFYETEDNHWEDLTDEEKSHYKLVINDKDGTTYLVAREVTRAGISPVDSQAIFLFALQKVREMPQSPVLNDFVVYIGADTYTYNAVIPTGSENPQELGWYESDGTDYTLSTDTTVTTGKTYYEREKALIQGGIYRFNGTTWELKSATGDIETAIAQNTSDISDLQDDKQDKTLETPLTIGGASRTTVEGALGALSTNKANKTEIPASLSDLTDDSTHRLVTDTEKTTWNGKQDTIILGDLTLPSASFNDMDSVATEIWNYVKNQNKTGLVNFYVIIENKWCNFNGRVTSSNFVGTIETLFSGNNNIWSIFCNDTGPSTSKLSTSTDLKYITIGTATKVSLPNNTGTLLATMTVPSAGKYLIIGSCAFSANSTGIRRLVFSSTSGSTTDDRYNAVSQNAVDGETTIMQVTTVITFASAGQNWYLNGFQNSDSTLTCFPAIRYIRLSD